MKAIVYRNYGGPDVLHVGQVEKPSPADNEVLIQIHASEVTKADCELRSFRFPVKWFWLPLRIAFGIRSPRRHILGGYFAGEIEAVGSCVSKFSKGDAVFGSAQLRLGGYGEYLCLPSSYTIELKPENMSFVQAAAVPLGGLNALHFLRKAGLREGEHILINGAGGSIGTFAVQLARSMGAEVTAVDSAIKEPMLRSIGVHHFIDYARQDFADSEQRYDVVLSMVAHTSYSKCIAALKPSGRYCLANPRVSDMIRAVFTTRFTGKQAFFGFAGERPDELQTLQAMIENGDIKSTVDKVYSMEHAAQAHCRVESEQRLGSVVVAISH